MNNQFVFRVPKCKSAVRLDSWLAEQMPELSRARVQALIKSGNILVDGKRVRAHQKIREGMDINVDIPPAIDVDLEAEDIPLEVIHEDSDLIVINKPAGLVVHPAAGHWSGTLVNALLFHCKDLKGIGGEMRPGIVHRLDKDTSGALVAAKNEQAMEALQRQFKDRVVRKEYLTIVHGTPSPESGEINTMIGRSSHDRKKMSVKPVSGREAITEYAVEERYDGTSLVRVRIATGRTHQIRVHMAHLGHPVVGDKQYGSAKRDNELSLKPLRQMLHAQFLALAHPSDGRTVKFEAPLWPDMLELIKKLKG
jgi:23S rRNA pseudouridine1911/1915/1917 synthase